MKFSAQALLEQQGWKEGQGLGKQNQGIKEAIKVKLKKDKTGIGHDFGEEFTYHWWDHAFNMAANKITVMTNDEGFAKLSNNGTSTELSTAKSAKRKKKSKKDKKSSDSKNLGNFIKSATLTDGITMSHTIDDNPESDDENDDLGTVSKFTDDDLFKLCGGLTAHKGARHGLTLKGKLNRINEQEQIHHNKQHCDQSTSVNENEANVLNNQYASNNNSVIDGHDAEKTRLKRKKSCDKEIKITPDLDDKNVSDCDEKLKECKMKKVKKRKLKT